MVEVNRLTTPENMRWNLVDRDDRRENAAIDWRFRVGDRVKIRLVNELDSDHPMPHPFHVHGAGRFLILARDGDGRAEPRLEGHGARPDRRDRGHPARRHESRCVDGALPHRRAPRERHDARASPWSRRSGADQAATRSESSRATGQAPSVQFEMTVQVVSDAGIVRGAERDARVVALEDHRVRRLVEPEPEPVALRLCGGVAPRPHHLHDSARRHDPPGEERRPQRADVGGGGVDAAVAATRARAGGRRSSAAPSTER